jgi:hypothetical protein
MQVRDYDITLKNTHIVNFLFICSNIPTVPAYVVYMS